jgi:hypothetical protein
MLLKSYLQKNGVQYLMIQTDWRSEVVLILSRPGIISHTTRIRKVGAEGIYTLEIYWNISLSCNNKDFNLFLCLVSFLAINCSQLILFSSELLKNLVDDYVEAQIKWIQPLWSHNWIEISDFGLQSFWTWSIAHYSKEQMISKNRAVSIRVWCVYSVG